MKTRVATMPLALILAIATTSHAHAQTASGDVVVMRRSITTPNPRPTPTPPPVTTPPTTTPPPASGGTWVQGKAKSNAPACSETAPATMPMTCRDATGNEMDASACASPRPSGATTVVDFSTCTYEPVLGDWTDWSRQCGAATRTRTNSCLRQPLGTKVDPQIFCSIPPEQTEGKELTAGCGTWTTSYGSCVAGRQNAVVSCVDSTGNTVSDGMCSAATRPAPTFDTCQYVEDFEKTPTGFSYPYLVTSSPSAHSGSFVMPLNTNGRNDTSVSASTTLVVGQTYYLTAWVRNAGATGTNTIQMLLYDNTKYTVNKTLPVGATWEKISIPFVASAKIGIIRLIQRGGDPGIQVDDVSLTLH